MKQLCSVILLCIVTVFVSCDKADQTEVITRLSENLFRYANEEKFDSLKLLYPGIETEYLDLNSDSLRIVKITENEKDENKVEVQLIKNYSANSDPNFNSQKSITLHLEKCDSCHFGYKISHSTGLLDQELIPTYAVECGAIKDKKYEDKDAMERIRIAKILYHQKAKEVADYLNSNIEILVNLTKIFDNNYAIVNDYKARFTLVNPTEYSCVGFTADVTLKDIGDMSLQAELKGTYNNTSATLMAYSRHNYSITFEPSDLKNPNSEFKCCITDVKFNITPEAVEQHTMLNFSGSEYNDYMKTQKNKKKSASKS